MHDFVGSLHHRVDPAVPPNPLEFIFGHEAFTTHDLNGGVGAFEAEVGAEDFANRGFQHDVFITSIHHPGCVGQHRFHGVDPCSLFGNVVLDEIKLANRPVKLVSVLRPFGTLSEGGPCRTNHAGRKGASAVIQTCQGDVQASSFVVEQMGLRNFDVFELHPCLPGPTNTTLGAVA